jgi:hypothetical protein
MKSIVVSGLVAALVVTAAASAQAPPGLTPELIARMQTEMRAYEALPDTTGTGPYPALKEADPAIPAHVIYRPANLAQMRGKKLGVLLWGNGGCAADGAGARFHLMQIASFGYVAIAPGTIASGPGAPPRPDQRPTGGMQVATTSADVMQGLDLLLAENNRKGSPYYHRIDPRAVAVSGHSCGGLQALQLAADPRIRAVVIHNSGIFPAGASPIRGMSIDKSALRGLHTPVIYILGGLKDIAWGNGTDDVAKIDHVPVALVSADVGHQGTFMEPNGGRAAAIAVDWLQWQLRHDRKAAQIFTGKLCQLCTDATWKIERKGIR